MRKVLLQMLLVTSFVASTIPTQAALEGTLPSLNNAIGGSVNSASYGLNVNVNGGQGAVGQFDWNSFSVGSDKKVNFGFSCIQFNGCKFVEVNFSKIPFSKSFSRGSTLVIP